MDVKFPLKFNKHMSLIQKNSEAIRVFLGILMIAGKLTELSSAIGMWEWWVLE